MESARQTGDPPATPPANRILAGVLQPDSGILLSERQPAALHRLGFN